jgi:hypothetical protein
MDIIEKAAETGAGVKALNRRVRGGNAAEFAEKFRLSPQPSGGRETGIRYILVSPLNSILHFLPNRSLRFSYEDAYEIPQARTHRF